MSTPGGRRACNFSPPFPLKDIKGVGGPIIYLGVWAFRVRAAFFCDRMYQHIRMAVLYHPCTIIRKIPLEDGILSCVRVPRLRKPSGLCVMVCRVSKSGYESLFSNSATPLPSNQAKACIQSLSARAPSDGASFPPYPAKGLYNRCTTCWRRVTDLRKRREGDSSAPDTPVSPVP